MPWRCQVDHYLTKAGNVLTLYPFCSIFVLMLIPQYSSKEQHLCSERVQVWRGKSGRRYVHTVYPAEACPEMSNAIYLAVGRSPSGGRRPLAIDGKRAFMPVADFDSAASSGRPETWAEEVHVHLLAQCDEQASRVIDDLRAEYGLPLN